MTFCCKTLTTFIFNELQTTQDELKSTKSTLDATHNELQSTKTTLGITQNELETTKLKLEQTMKELNYTKKDATKKENQIKFLQENIQKGIEYIQQQNENGFKMNHQITESFATYCSTLEQKQDFTNDETLDIFLNFFETRQPAKQFEQIEPIEINGRKLEFTLYLRIRVQKALPFRISKSQ